jgi:hypothetical protein
VDRFAGTNFRGYCGQVFEMAFAETRRSERRVNRVNSRRNSRAALGKAHVISVMVVRSMNTRFTIVIVGRLAGC